jgi:hypothetical protein
VPIALKSGNLTLLDPSGSLKGCNGIAVPQHPDRLWDAPNPLLNEYQGFLGIMPPESEANHSSPLGSEVKNEITSATPLAFMARGEKNYF